MAGDRASTGDPRADVQEASGALDPPRPAFAAQQTLAYRLATVADRVRSLGSKFGIRPYRVYLVHAHWTGNRKGNGTLLVSSKRELLPTPRVRDMSTIAQVIKATGRVEDGEVYVDQISATVPEADLMGQTNDLRDSVQPRTTPENAEFWWEVVEVRPSCPEPLVRRFYVKTAPSLRRDNFQWTVSLAKTDYDPGRIDDPEAGREARG